MLPFLLLFATLLFTFSGSLMKWIKKRFGRNPNSTSTHALESKSQSALLGVLAIQSFTAFYGGFFGGGIGIMMLATLRVLGMENIHEMNALKMLLSALINGAAVVVFAARGAIWWPQGVVMIIGAILGGYWGASIARKLDPLLVRRLVIVVGFAMTFYFFFLRQ
jgi:uncharacterized membrane protein YfcA